MMESKLLAVRSAGASLCAESKRLARVKDRSMRAQDPAAANIVSAVRPFEDPAPPGCMISIS